MIFLLAIDLKAMARIQCLNTNFLFQKHTPGITRWPLVGRHFPGPWKKTFTAWKNRKCCAV